jgi:hypothetical protein
MSVRYLKMTKDNSHFSGAAYQWDVKNLNADNVTFEDLEVKGTATFDGLVDAKAAIVRNFTAGGSISAGDPVSMGSDGMIYSGFGAVGTPENPSLTQGTPQFCDAVVLESGKVAIVYLDSFGDNKLVATNPMTPFVVIGDFNGTTWSFGTPTSIAGITNGSANSNGVAICHILNNYFTVFYIDQIASTTFRPAFTWFSYTGNVITTLNSPAVINYLMTAAAANNSQAIDAMKAERNHGGTDSSTKITFCMKDVTGAPGRQILAWVVDFKVSDETVTTIGTTQTLVASSNGTAATIGIAAGTMDFISIAFEKYLLVYIAQNGNIYASYVAVSGTTLTPTTRDILNGGVPNTSQHSGLAMCYLGSDVDNYEVMLAWTNNYQRTSSLSVVYLQIDNSTGDIELNGQPLTYSQQSLDIVMTGSVGVINAPRSLLMIDSDRAVLQYSDNNNSNCPRTMLLIKNVDYTTSVGEEINTWTSKGVTSGCLLWDNVALTDRYYDIGICSMCSKVLIRWADDINEDTGNFTIAGLEGGVRFLGISQETKTVGQDCKVVLFGVSGPITSGNTSHMNLTPGVKYGANGDSTFDQFCQLKYNIGYKDVVIPISSNEFVVMQALQNN